MAGVRISDYQRQTAKAQRRDHIPSNPVSVLPQWEASDNVVNEQECLESELDDIAHRYELTVIRETGLTTMYHVVPNKDATMYMLSLWEPTRLQ